MVYKSEQSFLATLWMPSVCHPKFRLDQKKNSVDLDDSEQVLIATLWTPPSICNPKFRLIQNKIGGFGQLFGDFRWHKTEQTLIVTFWMSVCHLKFGFDPNDFRKHKTEQSLMETYWIPSVCHPKFRLVPK